MTGFPSASFASEVCVPCATVFAGSKAVLSRSSRNGRSAIPWFDTSHCANNSAWHALQLCEPAYCACASFSGSTIGVIGSGPRRGCDAATSALGLGVSTFVERGFASCLPRSTAPITATPMPSHIHGFDAEPAPCGVGVGFSGPGLRGVLRPMSARSLRREHGRCKLVSERFAVAAFETCPMSGRSGRMES